MTGLVAVFLGLLAGWKLSDRFQVVMAVLIPFQVVLLVQTVGLALGKGVNPPSTVEDASYYVVQVLIFGFAVGIAVQLSALRFGHTGDRRVGRVFVLTLLGNFAFVALCYAAFALDRSFFDPGSVQRHTSGGPPIAGMAGILAAVLLCIGLGCVTLNRRRVAA
jgi:hypothetical protein